MVAAVALAARLRLAGVSRQRREDRREALALLGVERAQTRAAERAEVGVERVDERREGHVALELARAAGEPEVGRLQPVEELRDQARFPDPLLADDDDRSSPAAQCGDMGVQAVDLGRPAKELTGAREHAQRLQQRPAEGQLVGR